MFVPTNTTSQVGKRRLDAEINLVPFIDLLSMCICFLLMTAVWLQVGSLQIKQSHGTEASSAIGEFEMDILFTGQNSLTMHLKRKGIVVRQVLLASKNIEELTTKLDETLNQLPQLLKSKVQNPISGALVTPRQGVSYGNLVLVLDILRKHHVVNIGVVPSPAGA